MQKKIISFIDFFYPLFKKFMPLQTFRYAVCGGSNTLLGLLIYYIGFYHIFDKENFDAGIIVFKPHNASLFLAGCFSFTIGFILNKFIVFSDSYLRGRIQLFRYFLSFILNLIINYFLLNLFVEYLHIDAFLSQIIATIIVIIISFFTQKRFTFKTETPRLNMVIDPQVLAED
jgi:putative flippase GtrA